MTPASSDPWQAEPEWAACGASVTGREHQRRGLGCDDAYGYGVFGTFVVAAVADGAGSVTGTSAWGAYSACQSVLEDGTQRDFIDSFRTCGPDEAARLVRWLFDRALERVTHQAAALNLDLPLLSTTLCVAVADQSQAVFGRIGDGVIAVESDGDIRALLIDCKHGYANVTSFLQSDGAFEDSFRTVALTGVTAFALSTDGMAYKITNVATGEAYPPFFRDSWHHVRSGASAAQLAGLLSGIEDDQTGDDKTVVLAAIRACENENGSSTTELVVDQSVPPKSPGSGQTGTSPAQGAVPDPRPEPPTTGAEPVTVPLNRELHRRWRPSWGRRVR